VPNRLLWSPLRPAQLFNRLQLPFLAGILLISAATVVAVPSIERKELLGLGVGCAIVASALFLIPVRDWLLTPWIIVIPIIDIVSVAFVRAALHPYLPAVGMLCLLPFAWIAYRFRWPAMFLIFAGGVFIASLPFVLGGKPITDLLALLNVVTLPIIATGISIGIHLGSTSFKKGRRSVTAATEKLHAALNQSRDDELVLRSVLDTVNGAVAFYDAENKLVFANAAAEQMVGVVGFKLSAPPYAGSSVLMADRKTPIPFDEQIIPRALRGEAINSHMEWLGPQGSQVAILASSSRVHRETGDLLGTVIAAYDVTALADAIEVREEFLTTVSHELRTPLTSVLGYTDEVVDILGNQADHLGVATSLAAIARNGEALLERVGQLLSAADTRLELSPSQLDVGQLLGHTMESLAPTARRAGVTLLGQLPEDMFIEADPRRIGQAIENLLTNAIKFTPAGGSVTLSAAPETSDTVQISVVDTGQGMTRDETRRVFDRFYRAESARRHAVQGIGVGMSIVKAIVEAHRGKIDIESELGAGTTINICLPIVHTK
jgi:signal transduction histidine kinase